MTKTRIRTALMDGAIKVVARDGLDKLTTRSIASECDLHDSYIYRYFIDKEDLLRRAFLREDNVLIEEMLKSISFIEMEGADFREKLKAMWLPVWNYLIQKPDSCKFYVMYYYSVHFERDAKDEFKANNLNIQKKFSDLFPPDTDTELLFHYNIDTILHLAMKVLSGEIENTEDMSERVLDLLHNVNRAFADEKVS